MKTKETNGKGMDLTKEKLTSKEFIEDFFNKLPPALVEELERQFWGTYKVADGHGHITKTQFASSIREKNILDGAMSKCPDGYFKSKAEFNRAIHKTGRMFLLMWLISKNPEDEELRKMYKYFWALGQQEFKDRIVAGYNYAEKVEHKLMVAENPDIEAIREVRDMKKDLGKMKKKHKGMWDDD